MEETYTREMEPCIEDIFTEHIKEIREQLNAYESIVEEQAEYIEILQSHDYRSTIINGMLTAVIVYIYGAVLGVYMCPK